MWIITEVPSGDIKLHSEKYDHVGEFIEENDLKIGSDGHVAGKRWELQDKISRETKYVLECTEKSQTH